MKKKEDHPSTGSAEDALRCSFCNKSQHDVRKLIAGPSVCICDECIEVCNDIIADDTRSAAEAEIKDTRPPGDAAALSVGGDAARCALCRFPAPVADITWIAERGGLCPGCIGEIEAAIAAKHQ
jgi:hypothetical protein